MISADSVICQGWMYVILSNLTLQFENQIDWTNELLIVSFYRRFDHLFCIQFEGLRETSKYGRSSQTDTICVSTVRIRSCVKMLILNIGAVPLIVTGIQLFIFFYNGRRISKCGDERSEKIDANNLEYLRGNVFLNSLPQLCSPTFPAVFFKISIPVVCWVPVMLMQIQ